MTGTNKHRLAILALSVVMTAIVLLAIAVDRRTPLMVLLLGPLAWVTIAAGIVALVFFLIQVWRH
jgi:tryptophan-rich sensory protein